LCISECLKNPFLLLLLKGKSMKVPAGFFCLEFRDFFAIDDPVSSSSLVLIK
jgi:hypothetical protein